MLVANYKKSLFTNQAVKESKAIFKELTDMGELGHFSKAKLYTITSFKAVKKKPENPVNFAYGNILLFKKLLINKDESSRSNEGKRNRNLKSLIKRNLGPQSIKTLRDKGDVSAKNLVKDLLQRKEFDMVHDFAAHLPLNIDLLQSIRHARGKYL